MTHVRFKNKANGVNPFNNLLGDVFPMMPSLYKEVYPAAAPVNIKETESSYEIEIAAPGMNKEDFKIDLENSTLSISVERKEETLKESEKQIKKEFSYQSFKRSFTIDDNIETEGISAQYVNGVLTLNLPKKQEVKPATKQINVQ